MELEVTKVRVRRTGVGKVAVQSELVLTTLDGRQYACPISDRTATEFERLAVRATPREKL